MSSLSDGKQEAVNWVKEHFQQGDTCLDVGACNGVWHDLLGDYLHMDAVEIFKPYINKYKLKDKYHKVFNTNVCIFKYDYYDLIILGDVLEHMAVNAAQNVIEYAKQHCRNLLIAVPFGWEQGAINKNPWEVHLQPDLTPELFDERYPGFKPIYQIDNYAYYTLEKQQEIAVIVPYYNSEAWIERCCKSLSAQRGDDMHFILVDDKSTDNSSKIVKEFATTDHRFITLTNTKRKGVSGARNTGLEHALYELDVDWVTFLDSDDEMCKDAFATFHRYDKQSDHNIVQFEHYRHYEAQNKTVINKHYSNPAGEYYVGTKLPIFFCMVWNKLYRASLLKHLSFQDGMKYGEDEIFNLACLAKDPYIFVDEYPTIIHHFENKQSLCRSKTIIELINQSNALQDFIVKHNDPVIRKAVCALLSEHWSSKTYLEVIENDGKV